MRGSTLQYIHEEKSNAVWSAFGQFVNKQLKNGRGVWIPKFGQFSFTGMTVDLQGSTNPNERDHQQRFPVFIIGKDFVSSNPVKAGILSGMTNELFDPNGQQSKSVIRRYNNANVNGIIPKLRINFAELATLTDGVASKEQCKFHIDQIVKRMSDNTRSGMKVEMDIPHVGQLQIKNGVAGVIFDQSLIEECYGQTAKKYNALFIKNDWMNNKMFEPNKCNYSIDDFQHVKDLDISPQGKKWLQNNMDIDYDNVYQNAQTSVQQTKKIQKLESSRNSVLCNNQNSRKVVPRMMRSMSVTSAVRAKTLNPTISRFSAVSSVMSRVPDLAPFQLMNLATDIYGYKKQMIEQIQNGRVSIRLRDQLSSSQIQKLISMCQYRVQIGHLKALLKELGFQWNGKSCSIQQLLQRLKEYINPVSQAPPNPLEEIAPVARISPEAEGFNRIVNRIRDSFYATGKTLFQLYRSYNLTNSLNFRQFLDLITSVANGSIQDKDIQIVFNKLQSEDVITFHNFEVYFKLRVPNPGSHNMEVEVIKKVREWMFVRQMPAEGAFQRLVRSVDRLSLQTLRRQDLRQAANQSEMKLTQAEIDFLFDLLAGASDQITPNDWLMKIYDDVTNPLQLIREVVQSLDLNIDDILLQMKLKIWDEPLEFNQFQTCIRKLDPSYSDSQSKALFRKLKGNNEKVDIQVMLNNFTGTVHDTIDYRNKMFKELYKGVYEKGLQDQLLNQLEQFDPKCDGKIAPKDLERALKHVTGTQFTNEELLKFTRQLQKDDNYKVSYIEFLDRMTALGNKDHNPFKSLMQRLAYFLESNKVTPQQLLTRLARNQETENIDVQRFADFLKQKVDKKKDLQDLVSFATYIDVDKDGFINLEDLKTCLRNINSQTFYQNASENLSISQFNTMTKFFPTDLQENITDEKLLALCKQIRVKMGLKSMAYNTFFNNIDTKSQGMINLGQFIVGVNKVISVSSPILEKLFNIMDTNAVGMVDFDKFSHILKMTNKAEIPRVGKNMEDSFEWQEMIINMIRNWVIQSKINSTEAFRSFDHDFNGLISKQDMKTSLIDYLKIKELEITQIRLDRLFKLLSFYKSDQIQQSDFERLLNDTNPYETSATGSTSSTFKQSMGGGFQNVSTLDWKFAAIQQIGLTISKHFNSIEDSFNNAAQLQDKVDFDKFQAFVNRYQGLQGFNITKLLLEKIFAEMDPHKKTYLDLQDWKSGFQMFNQNDQLMIELKNAIQCQFNSNESAFSFFQHIGETFKINFTIFCDGLKSMLIQKKLNIAQKRWLYQKIAGEKQEFDLKDFSKEFSNIVYSGKQVIPMIQKKGHKHAGSKAKHMDATCMTGQGHQKAAHTASKWETDIIDKLKRILTKNGKSLENIFQQFDYDGSGEISNDEFRKAMKMISINLTDADIQALMQRVDANNDGIISYLEFAAKFRQDPLYDARMKKRANNRLAKLKQQMVQYMVSPIEAFKMFDKTHEESLSYLDFDKLVRELHRLENEPVPCYSVIKDMFDAIDTNKDSIIDLLEWQKIFGEVQNNDIRLVLKTTPMSSWADSLEATKIATCMAKNRKLLIEGFKKYSTHSDYNGISKYVTFEQAKKAIEEVLRSSFDNGVSDQKIECLLQVGQVVQKIQGCPSDIKIFDFMHILNVYRDRHQGPKFI